MSNSFQLRYNNFYFIQTEEDENAPIEGPADISRYLIADGNTIEKIKISFDGSAKPHIFSVVLARKKKDELPIVPLRYSDPNLTFKLCKSSFVFSDNLN